MSTIQEAIKSVQDYGNNFTSALERHRGYLGDGDGTVYVADRDGYVYVRNRQAESADITGTMEPEEVIYSRSDIPPIEGYPVIFGRDIDTEDFQVLATDTNQLLGWIFDKYIKDHHEQHEFNEYDTVWVQKQAMLPLLVYPTSPASTTVSVFGGWYQWDTSWHYFETTTSSELSSYVPVQAGRARFLLVCIDGETEALHYESGDTFLEYVSPQDCEDRIPPPPEGKIPLAAIYLVVGETSFDWDIIYDVRLLFSGGGSMSTGSAPRDAAYVTLAYNDILSAERLLSAGNGIVVTDNGANDTVVVSLDDHDHSGDVGDGGIIPGTSVELPEIGTAIYDDVTDWFNTTQSAGRLSGGAITDNGDGTIDVAIGTGYIKVADADLANTLFFDWPATAAPLTPTDDAKNWVYVDYNGGTPVVGITDDENTITRNDLFYIARLWRDGNDLHIVNHGQSAYNLSMRTDRYLADVFHNIRSSGQVTAEKNERYLTVTAGIMFHGLSLFETAAVDTSLTGAGDIFTYYYRDGAAGWTTGTASQIDNVNYDDGTGALEPVTVKQYGVFWVYLCHESRLYVQYGQDSYKLAAAQESQVPVPPPFLAGFANLIARVIVQRNAANLEEIAYPWDEIFMPQAATDHNQLGNLQGGAVDEYYHIDLNAYEQLSGGGAGVLPNVGAEGYALVSTGVNTWGADDTPLWKGRHSFEAGITFAGGAGVNSVVIPDGLADAFDITNGVEFLRLNTDANYFLVDPGLAGIKFGLGTAAPAGSAHIYGTSGTTELIIDCQGDTNDEQAVINLITLGDGTKDLGNAATLGWHISARGDAWVTVTNQNDLWFHYWDGSSYNEIMVLDHTGLITVFNGISFAGATGDNEIFVLDNESIALELLDVGGLEYMRIVSTNVNPYFLIDPAGAGINVGIGTATPGAVGYAKLELYGTQASAAGPHTVWRTSEDAYPVQQVVAWQHDNASIYFDAYYDGADRSSDAGSNARLHKRSDKLIFKYDSGVAQGGVVTWNDGIVLDLSTGNVGIGTATPGGNLELHAAAGTNVAFWLSDADVNHPFTGIGFIPEIQSDVLGSWINAAGAEGGYQLNGFTDDDATPIFIYSHIGDATPTQPGIILGAWKTDGGVGRTALAAAEIVLQVHNGAGVLATTLGNGYLGLGLSPAYKLDLLDDNPNDFVAQMFNDGDNVNRNVLLLRGGGEGADVGTTYFLYCSDHANAPTGCLKTVNGVFQLADISDEGRKANIVDTKIAGLDIIKGLKVRDFTWKANPDSPVMTSFIAQEAQQVWPAMVGEFRNGELGTSRGMLVPILTKAIQELDERLVKLELSD